jgi:RimJ/RimL family protein N-acetyltransferase
MSVMTAEPVSTPRLALLPLRVAHADEMAIVLADPGLHNFTGGSPLTPQALRSRYERMIAGSGDPAVSWCNWVIQLRDTERLAGTVQATISAGDELEAEVAWVVGRQWQGQGIASEAARALIGWLGRQSVQTVIAHIHPGHQASAAVAAAAGLTPTDQVDDGEIRWRLRTGTRRR